MYNIIVCMRERNVPPLKSSENWSVLFHSSIDLADKDVGGIEADGPGEEPESQHHNHGVAEIEHGRYDTHYLQL